MAKLKTKRAKPVPKGMATVTPHLVCGNCADAIEFYKGAFRAVEVSKLLMPDGDRIIHAMIQIGDSMVMLMDEFPEWGAAGPITLNGSPVTLHLYVEDVDAFIDRAVWAGATVTMPVQDTFWGDRYGKLEDPFGHKWSVATHIRDIEPEQIAHAAREFFSSMGGNEAA
jgi:uncharacterized glyoxalase superfamily protein PhnB